MTIYAYSLGSTIGSLLANSNSLTFGIVEDLKKALIESGNAAGVGDFLRGVGDLKTKVSDDTPLTQEEMTEVRLAHHEAGIAATPEMYGRWLDTHTYRQGVARGGQVTGWYYSHYKNACKKAGVEPLEPLWNTH